MSETIRKIIRKQFEDSRRIVKMLLRRTQGVPLEEAVERIRRPEATEEGERACANPRCESWGNCENSAHYRKYRRTQIAEMRDWTPDCDMEGVSVSEADRKNGSPKPGDKIARNPKNHDDRWLVSAEYFRDNFVAWNRRTPDGEVVAYGVRMLDGDGEWFWESFSDEYPEWTDGWDRTRVVPLTRAEGGE